MYHEKFSAELTGRCCEQCRSYYSYHAHPDRQMVLKMINNRECYHHPVKLWQITDIYSQLNYQSSHCIITLPILTLSFSERFLCSGKLSPAVHLWDNSGIIIYGEEKSCKNVFSECLSFLVQYRIAQACFKRYRNM